MNQFVDTEFTAFIHDLPRPVNPAPSRHHEALVDITTVADSQPVFLDMTTGKVVRPLPMHDSRPWA